MCGHETAGSWGAGKKSCDVLVDWFPTTKEMQFGATITIGCVVGFLVVAVLCLLGLVVGGGKVG